MRPYAGPRLSRAAAPFADMRAADAPSLWASGTAISVESSRGFTTWQKGGLHEAFGIESNPSPRATSDVR